MVIGLLQLRKALLLHLLSVDGEHLPLGLLVDLSEMVDRSMGSSYRKCLLGTGPD